MIVISLDPGRYKNGAAVLSETDGVLWQGIVPCNELIPFLKDLAGKYHPDWLVLGDGTGAKTVIKHLEQQWPSHIPVRLVDEHLSSREGRRRFLLVTARRGWRRWIPIALQSPWLPYDDFVAVILGERFFHDCKSLSESKN
ncbi:MAG: pre-16S rRNA-processing nuclease YqgF [Bacillota bacterium]